MNAKTFWQSTLTCVVVGFLIAIMPSLLGQSTNAPPPLEPLPQTNTEFWQLAIAFITPLIVWAARAIVPKIPTVLLPTMTPFLGIVLGLLLKWAGTVELSWIDMAQAGAMAVAVREIFNQAVTKRLQGETTTPAVKT